MGRDSCSSQSSAEAHSPQPTVSEVSTKRTESTKRATLTLAHIDEGKDQGETYAESSWSAFTPR